MEQLLDSAQSYYSEVLRLFALCITLVTIRLKPASLAANSFFKHRKRWIYYLDEKSYFASIWQMVRLGIYAIIITILIHIILLLVRYISIHDQFLTQSPSLAYFAGQFVVAELLELKGRVLIWAKVILALFFIEFLIFILFSWKYHSFDIETKNANINLGHIFSKANNWGNEAKGNWLEIEKTLTSRQPTNDYKLKNWESWVELVEQYKIYHSQKLREELDKSI